VRLFESDFDRIVTATKRLGEGTNRESWAISGSLR
jgi:hypothetical protein